MAKAARHLCKWKKKDLENDFGDLLTIVAKPKYVCKRCARAARARKFLCKPVSLSDA